MGSIERPGWIDAGRVPCLDGLRGVAVAAVVASHAGARVPGHVGVDLFFVLSGFLITLLMLRERDRTGRVDLKAFYLRRTLRIFPAYYAFLAAVALALAARPAGTTWRGLGVAACYLTGYVPRGEWLGGIGHTWSLSTEETFYLAWPALFVLAPRVAPGVLAAALALSTPARLLAYPRMSLLRLHTSVPYRLDGLAVGCLMALTLRGPRGPRLLSLGRRAWLPPLALGVLAASEWLPSTRYRVGPRGAVDSVALAALALACVARPGSRAGRLLSSGPPVRLGTLSYSLYLWHWALLDARSPLAVRPAPLALAAALACACASHYLVERPFLRLKDRAAVSAAS